MVKTKKLEATKRRMRRNQDQNQNPHHNPHQKFHLPKGIRPENVRQAMDGHHIKYSPDIFLFPRPRI